MMYLGGGITAERDGMVICRTSELHNQGISGAFGACKSFAPEGATSIGRGLRPPRPPLWIRPWARPLWVHRATAISPRTTVLTLSLLLWSY